jgi:hypothetical protein
LPKSSNNMIEVSVNPFQNYDPIIEWTILAIVQTISTFIWCSMAKITTPFMNNSSRERFSERHFRTERLNKFWQLYFVGLGSMICVS